MNASFQGVWAWILLAVLLWVLMAAICLAVVAVFFWYISLPLIVASWAVYSVVAPERRHSIMEFFFEPAVSSSQHATRKTTTYVMLTFAALCAGVPAGLDLGPASVPWWFIACLLWTVGLHLLIVDRDMERRRRVAYRLLSNAREFVLTVTIVLGVYVLASVWVGGLPLDDTTLLKLRTWEGAVAWIHIFLDALKPSIPQLTLLFLAFWSLRWVDRQFAGRVGAVDVADARVRLALRWTERAALAALIAASVTFLGTEANGPVRKISAQIRDMTKQYQEFQHVIRREVDRSLRVALLDRAWKDRPPTMRREMVHSRELISLRRNFHTLAFEARHEYYVTTPDPPGYKQEAPPRPNSEPDKVVEESGYLPESATMTGIRTAILEGKKDKAVSWPRSTAAEKETVEDEALEKILVDVLPVERLTDKFPGLGMLNTAVPVLGQFIETVASAFTGEGLEKVKNALVPYIAAKKLLTRRPLYDLVAAEADHAANSAKLDWSPYSSEWSDRVEENLSRLEAPIEAARRDLVTRTGRVQADRVRSVASWVDDNVDHLRMLGIALQERSYEARAERAHQLRLELVRMSRNWPAIGSANDRQIDALWEAVSHAGLGLASGEEGRKHSPLRSMYALGFRCDDMIVDAVAKFGTSSNTVAAVRYALGSDFDFYAKRFQEQVQQQVNQRQQRRVAAQRAEFEKMQREYEDLRRKLNEERPEEAKY
jgi:hypothetical protein